MDFLEIFDLNEECMKNSYFYFVPITEHSNFFEIQYSVRSLLYSNSTSTLRYLSIESFGLFLGYISQKLSFSLLTVLDQVHINCVILFSFGEKYFHIYVEKRKILSLTLLWVFSNIFDPSFLFKNFFATKKMTLHQVLMYTTNSCIFVVS